MQPLGPIRKRFESLPGKLGPLGLKSSERLLQFGNLLLDAIAALPRCRCGFGLFGADLPGDFAQPLEDVFAVRRRETHAILRKPLDWIVAEVRKPGVVLAFEARFKAQLVLVDPPRDTKIFESLGERRPACPAAIVNILVEDVSERIRGLLRPDGAGPEVQTVGSRAGEARAEVLIADGECVRERIVKRNVLARVVSQRQRHFGERLFVRSALHPAIGRSGHRSWHRPGSSTNAAESPSRSIWCP